MYRARAGHGCIGPAVGLMIDVRAVMKDYFLQMDRIARTGERKIAWCTSVGPAEILRALDFEVFFPENHGAMLGASRMSLETIPQAHAVGYSPDICSYLTSDIGAYLKKMTPLTKAYSIESIPRPDVLVYNTNQCKDVMHWFEYYSREFGVPVLGIHPPTHIPVVQKSHVDGVVCQFENLVAQLETIAGRRLDPQRLRQTIALSREATELWSEALDLARHRPSPLSFFDACVLMGPIVVLRGTDTAVAFYRSLVGDLKKKIEKSQPAVKTERKRIYWDGMPIWGRLRALSELFAKNQACVVASTYFNSLIF